MSAQWRVVILALLLIPLGTIPCDLWGQQNHTTPSILHIQQSVTTSKTGFPTFVYIYHVLDGTKSTAAAQALTGTILLRNYSSNFSEVLWLLAYWQGTCPVNDRNLNGANYIWSDILKNPSQSDSTFRVDLHFPHSLPMTGCVGFGFGGGPLIQGKVTMAADLNLTYKPSSPVTNTVVDLSGEYCFGQNWGCQNATTDDAMGFGFPIVMPAGQLVELFGNISDSTFDGTQNFGPLPARLGEPSTIFTCFPVDAENLDRISTAKGSRIPCCYRRYTAGFPPTLCTLKACHWNTRFPRTGPARLRFKNGSSGFFRFR